MNKEELNFVQQLNKCFCLQWFDTVGWLPVVQLMPLPTHGLFFINPDPAYPGWPEKETLSWCLNDYFALCDQMHLLLVDFHTW